jgi:hypothetical protein
VAVILEFEGVGEAQYRFVNTKLGIDTDTGEGDWPAGLLRHTAGATDDGGFVVFEVWETPDAQREFLRTRLAAAMQAGGVPEPRRATWVELLADHHP